MENTIKQTINGYIAKVNKIHKDLFWGKYPFQGKFNQEKLASHAKLFYDDWLKLADSDKYDIEEFECTVHSVHISWMKHGKLGGTDSRDMGDSDKPRNLLWITIVLMYYDAIDTPDKLHTWLLEFQTRYPNCLTDKGVEWAEENARIITNDLDKSKKWPDRLLYARQTPIETGKTAASTTLKLNTSPLDTTAQNLSDLRVGTADTDEHHLSQIEDACSYFERNTENLPKLKKRMGVLTTKMFAFVLWSE